MYIGGGFADGGVLVCEVKDLLQSATPQPPHTHHSQLWRKIAKLPADRSFLVPLHGQLLAIGGKSRSDDDGVSEVRQYDTTTKSWRVISQMHLEAVSITSSCAPQQHSDGCGRL